MDGLDPKLTGIIEKLTDTINSQKSQPENKRHQLHEELHAHFSSEKIDLPLEELVQKFGKDLAAKLKPILDELVAFVNNNATAKELLQTLARNHATNKTQQEAGYGVDPRKIHDGNTPPPHVT